MQYLFLTFVAIAIAAFAPLAVTLSLVVCLAVVTLVVKVTASKVIGSVSVLDAARAAGWSFALLALAAVMVLWAFGGKVHVEGLMAVGVLVGLFVAFVLGFKLALNASFGASAVVAVISTLVSAVCLYTLRPVLF